MRFLPTLVLTVFVAGAAVLAYDQLRSDAAAPAAGYEAATELDDLRARLAALEAGKPVELRTDGAAGAALRRIEELEARLAKLEQRPAPATERPSVERSQPMGSLASKELTPEEVERFRQLRKAARADDVRAKRTAHVTAALDKAGLRLSEAQRDKVVAAQAAFGERFNQIWSEAKSSAAEQGDNVDWTTVIRETNQTIQTEFATQVSSFLPQADAESVAAALYPSRGK